MQSNNDPKSLVSILRRKYQPLSYDSAFETAPEERFFRLPNRTNSAFLTGYENPFTYNHGQTTLEDLKAERQPWIAKTGAGFGRLGIKIASEILKMPGVLGGIAFGIAGQASDLITGEDNTDFIQTAFNNPWIKAIDTMEQNIKEEVLPVYIRKAVKEGNLWDNITSMDFWATEGADGLGYIISMLAPGAAISKFGLASKTLGVNNLTRMLGNTKRAEKALSTLNKIGINSKNADLIGATAANTIFEAAAEAKGAMDGYMLELNHRRSLPIDDPNYITQEQYDELAKNQSKVGRDVFVANAAILVGPNAIMSKILWGRPLNKMVDKAIDSKGALQRLGAYTTREGLKDFGIAGGAAVFREGFWEEGTQSTAEEFFKQKYAANAASGPGEFVEAYIDMLGTTEGQKAIFLGALFGGLMGGGFEVRNEKQNREAINKLIDATKTSLSKYHSVFNTDVFVKDNEGNILYDKVDGQPIARKDPAKLLNNLMSLQKEEKMSAIYDLAIAQGDLETAQGIRDYMTTQLVKPFIVNSGLGLEVLKQHLETSAELSKSLEIEGQDKADFIKKIMEKAEYMQKKFTTFQELGSVIFKLENEKATADERTYFYNHMLGSFYMDLHGQRFIADQQLNKSENMLGEILSEKNIDPAELESNNRRRRDESQKDSRLEQLYKDISKFKTQVEQADKALDKFWNGENVQKEFDKFISEREKVRKELEAKEKIVSDVIDKIGRAKTLKELDDIAVPEGLASKSIEEAKTKKKEELLKKEASRKDEVNDDIEKKKAEEAEQVEKAQDEFDNISNNKGKGDVINVTPDLDEGLQGQDITIDEVNDEEITGTLNTGEKVVIIKPKDTKEDITEEYNTTSEGGKNTSPQAEDKQDVKSIEKNNTGSSRIMITDNNEGKKLSWASEAALEFERSPRNKVGTELHVEVNPESFNDNQKAALEAFKKNDFSDMELLINHLPLKVVLSEGVLADLETRTENEAYNAIFEETAYHMRKTIINELATGTKLSDITVVIKGQNRGNLMLAPNPEKGKVAENPLAGLYDFGNDPTNITKDHIYMVDKHGVLKNNRGDILPTVRDLRDATGEMYIAITMANGQKFPLKLNVAKISEDKAEILYELMKYRFNDFEDGKRKEDAGSKSTRIVDTTSELKQAVEDNFREELKLFKKSFNDITVKDIIDFLIWDGTDNAKSRVSFYKGKLRVRNTYYDKAAFATEAGKSNFIYTITNNKRHQIKFKKKQNDTNNLNINDSVEYLQYLLNNNILNTNAVIGEHTFQGNTTMYVNTADVRVKGETSKFNTSISSNKYNKNLIGNNSMLEKKAPGLFSNPVQETPDGKNYQDKNGELYDRVSSLKDDNIDLDKNTNQYNAAKRGDAMDKAARDFFSQKAMTLQEFITKGQEYVKEQNVVKPKTLVQIEDSAFEDLYRILHDYKVFFDNKGWTIYSKAPTMSGQLGNKNYAGTVDFLAYDNANDTFYIIDLKTSTSNRIKEYEGKDKFGYKEKDTIQLNAYAELFKQMTGKTIAGVFIMPIKATSVTKENDYYDSAEQAYGKFIYEIDMSKDIYTLKNIAKPTTNKTTGKKDGAAIAAKLVPTAEETEDLSNEVMDESEKANVGKFNPAKFGLAPIEEDSKKSKPSKKPAQTNNDTIPESKRLEILEALQKLFPQRVGQTFEYNGRNYEVFIQGFYIFNLDTNQPVMHIPTILNIWSEYNLQAVAKFKVDLNQVRLKFENMAGKSAPVEIETKETTLQKIEKISEEEATIALKNIIKSYGRHPAFGRDMQAILKKHASNKGKLRGVVEYLINREISKEELETKCNL